MHVRSTRFVWTGHECLDSAVDNSDWRQIPRDERPWGSILSLAIMGKSLFSGSQDGFIYQWDLVTGLQHAHDTSGVMLGCVAH